LLWLSLAPSLIPALQPQIAADGSSSSSGSSTAAVAHLNLSPSLKGAALKAAMPFQQHLHHLKVAPGLLAAAIMYLKKTTDRAAHSVKSWRAAMSSQQARLTGTKAK
jgi:hypothetical protein